MRSLLMAAVLLSGCAPADGPPAQRPSHAVAAGHEPADPFSARVASGCKTEEECHVLNEEAMRRVMSCQRTLTCDQAIPNQRATNTMLQVHVRRRGEAEAAARKSLAEEAERTRAAAETAKQAAITEAHAAERQKLLDEAVADQPNCESGGEGWCTSLRRFMDRYRDHPINPTFAEAINNGAAARAQIQREKEEAEARAARSAAAAAKKKREEAGEPAPAPAGRVCCCDGSVSPTCTFVKRGCCSRHGGVCACN
jgi:hypothetical protein